MKGLDFWAVDKISYWLASHSTMIWKGKLYLNRERLVSQRAFLTSEISARGACNLSLAVFPCEGPSHSLPMRL
jgi:hypothetical protein